MRACLGAAAVVATILGGCASVTRGWEEDIHFSSYPTEAQVRASTGHTCITPCVMKFSRKTEFTAVFSKPGFITQEVPVVARLGGAGAAGFVGNALIGGVVGAGVDIASGASLDHCPNPVSVTLQRVGSKEPPVNAAASCMQTQFGEGVSKEKE